MTTLTQVQAVVVARKAESNGGACKLVKLAELLDRIGRFIRRYVVLGEHELVILALYVAHTWTSDTAEATPYVVVESAEKASGKTRLLEVLALLCWEPWHTASVSESTLFRTIEAKRPTLLLDEVDALFKSNSDRTEPVRAVLNAGNRKGVTIPRCVPPKWDVHDFSVYCPKVLAGISTGRLPETIRDRSITIKMRRRVAAGQDAGCGGRDRPAPREAHRGDRMSLLGIQVPRIRTVPPCESSTASEALDLCRHAGLTLDPWQEMVLAESLGETADHKWAAFECALCTPRQSGKNEVILAREIVGLFLLREKFIVHSAHRFPMAQEHFRRLLAIIEGVPEFASRVKRTSRSHGEEGIELVTGQRIQFRTRTASGARGYSADLVVCDEAMILSDEHMATLIPTLSARPNPQVWMVGSAVDREVHADGAVFSRLRVRAMDGASRVAYWEWSVDAASPDGVADTIVNNPHSWAVSNPGLGRRISVEQIEAESSALDRRSFCVERCGIGDWYRLDGHEGDIDPVLWADCLDPGSKLGDTYALGFDVDRDRLHAAILAASPRADDAVHLEIVEARRGTDWLAPRLHELAKRREPTAIVCDRWGLAGGLDGEVKDLRPRVTELTTAEYSSACARFFDAVQRGTIRHLGQSDLNHAARVAVKKPGTEGFVWKREGSTLPITAGTLALHGAVGMERGIPHIWHVDASGEPATDTPPPSATEFEIAQQGWTGWR
jgi:hypothetical protein